MSTDDVADEYSTFVPDGNTCTGCGKPIARLDRCRRATQDRQSGAPATSYRHIDCADPKGLNLKPAKSKVSGTATGARR